MRTKHKLQNKKETHLQLKTEGEAVAARIDFLVRADEVGVIGVNGVNADVGVLALRVAPEGRVNGQRQQKDEGDKGRHY